MVFKKKRPFIVHGRRGREKNESSFNIREGVTSVDNLFCAATSMRSRAISFRNTRHEHRIAF